MGAILEAFKALKLWQIGVLAAVLVGGTGATYGVYTLVGDSDQGGLAEGQQLIPVQRGDLVNQVSTNGSLLFPNRESLTFGTQGTVGEVLVEEGQQVDAGQPLARLDAAAVASLKKAVAQARINVRTAEDALAKAENPHTPLDMAQAEERVTNAGLSLRNADDALANLLEPTSQDVAQAEERVSNAKLALRNAEDALAKLLAPTSQDVAQAEERVTNARLAIKGAEDTLDTLLHADAQLIAKAAAAVTDAKLALGNASTTLDALKSEPSDEEVAKAEERVTNAKLSLKNSEDALDRLLEPTSQDVAQAEERATNARLALRGAEDTLDKLLEPISQDVAQAEERATSARLALRGAEDTLDRLLHPDAQVIAKAAAAVTDAKLALENASTTLDALNSGPSDEDVAKARSQVDSSGTTLANARRDLKLAQKEWEDKLRMAQENVDAALGDYQVVLKKWLGVDVGEEEASLTPDMLLRSWGADLATLFEPTLRFSDLGQFLSTRDIPANDPNTLWDEATVYTWLNFWPGSVFATCEGRVISPQTSCVKEEIDGAWGTYQDTKDSLDTGQTQAAKAIANAESAVARSEESLATAEGAMADLKVVTDLLDIEVKERQIAVALANLDQAQEDLTTLTNEPDPLDVEAKRRQVAVARANLDQAQEDLTTLINEPDPLEVEAKRRQVAVARANLDQAQEDLTTLTNEPDPLEVEAKRRHVAVARANLDQAQEDLTTLTNEPDPLEVEAKRRHVAVARANLDQTQEDLDTLTNEPDPLEVEAKRRHVAVARANLDQDQEDLAALTNEPDPLEVEAKQRQVAVARANVDQAQEDLAALTNGPDPLEVEAKRRQVAVARASLDQNQEDLAELKASVDPLEVALRQADVAAAGEALETAIKRQEDATLLAPMAGIVSLVNVESGQGVNANAPIVQIVDPTVVEVDGIVDEIDVLFVRIGARAEVTMDALPGQVVPGTVSEIAPGARSQQGVVSYPIRIQLQVPEGVDLRVGLSATASIILREERNVLLVPIQALYGTFDQPVVRVTVDGRIEERAVVLGNSDDVWVAVHEGLAEGERVVMEAEQASTSQFGFGAGFRRLQQGQFLGAPPGGGGGRGGRGGGQGQ